LSAALSLLFITERIFINLWSVLHHFPLGTGLRESWFESEEQLSTNVRLQRPQIMHNTLFDSLTNSVGIWCCCIGILTPLVLPAGSMVGGWKKVEEQMV
jgi:hypothetical protein